MHTVTVAAAKGEPQEPMLEAGNSMQACDSTWKATGTPGTDVVVKARADGEDMVVEITNQGAPIPADQLEANQIGPPITMSGTSDLLRAASRRAARALVKPR